MGTATAAPRRRTAHRIAARFALTLSRPRRHGDAVTARTIDLSSGGARVVADRPLKIDEVLAFDLACDDDLHVRGECRVLREHVGRTYAVRFERLDGEDAVRALERLTRA